MKERSKNGFDRMDEIATDTEAMVFLSNLSLEAPLSQDYTEIFLYVATTELKRAGREIPDDIKVEKLSDYRLSLLDHLKHEIYKRKINERKRAKRGHKDHSRLD